MSEATPTNEAVELPFQAEVREVLSLVIGSLYANQEVFLRELISNAADALDKARFLALTRDDVTRPEGEPSIAIRLDETAHTLTIEDDGVGMTRDEAVQNLGTIAKSGSREFFARFAEQAKSKDRALELIGQFGVGFYAAFMVASRIDVTTKSLLAGEPAVLWRSSGTGSFTVAPGERDKPGTEIVLHLKPEAEEYSKAWRVKEIIRKYSDFVSAPITVDGEVVNRSKALWTQPKSSITTEQHTELYRHLTGGYADAPLLHVHHSVDAPVQFHALLYVPERAPVDLFRREFKGGVRLYAKRVLILEECDKLLPVYLRFIRGVVDSEDLSLNVSREMLQEDKTLRTIEQTLTKQVLRALKELGESDAASYAKLWGEFGRILKEGVSLDWKNKEAIAELCRFESMKTPAGQWTSLGEYVAKMQPDQTEIFYVTGLSRRAVADSPHLEAFRKRGIDVLFLIDAIDEWVVQALPEFAGKKLRSVAHGKIDLGGSAEEASPSTSEAAVGVVKSALGDRVKDVRLSRRLTDSASCLVADDGDPGANLERIMKLVDQKSDEAKRILELNPDHAIVQNLAALAEREPTSPRLGAWAELLLDQALLAEGVVSDPAALVRRVQDLLVEVSSSALKS
jgi:molecular chaperone HtpG